MTAGDMSASQYQGLKTLSPLAHSFSSLDWRYNKFISRPHLRR